MITSTLTLARILTRLWDTGKAKDFIYLTEARRLNEDRLWVRGHHSLLDGLQNTVVFWDEDDDAWLESRGA